jgi:hypothetical protein
VPLFETNILFGFRKTYILLPLNFYLNKYQAHTKLSSFCKLFPDLLLYKRCQLKRLSLVFLCQQLFHSLRIMYRRAFRENLTNNGLVEKIFTQLTKYLESKGLIMHKGKMVDASFTITPPQRNTAYI